MNSWIAASIAAAICRNESTSPARTGIDSQSPVRAGDVDAGYSSSCIERCLRNGFPG